jgi:DNA-binding response OmpR family regulator
VRVLVVDDHRNTRESLALGLTLLGYEPDVAAGGAEALTCLEERTYRWLICDVRMPGTSGVELACSARRRQADIGVILMTAYDVSHDERQIIEALQADLVIKPVTATALARLCGARDCSPIEPKELQP